MKKRIIAHTLILSIVMMLFAGITAFASVYNRPEVVAVSVVSSAGRTVKVPIRLANNPGITSMRLEVNFKSKYFTLTDVIDSGVLGENAHSNDYSGSPYTLVWENDTATQNYYTNGTIALLVFDVAPNTPVGRYDVKVTYNEQLDVNEDFVKFYAVDGEIAIEDYVVGDIDDDDVVDAKDRMYLSRHLANWLDYGNIETNTADVNCDGKVNTKDRMYLSRYLAGWRDYEEFTYDVKEETLIVPLQDLNRMPTSFAGVYTFYNEDGKLVSVSVGSRYDPTGAMYAPDVYINGVHMSDITNRNMFDTVSELSQMIGTIEFALLDLTNTTADFDTIYIEAAMPFVVDEVKEGTSTVKGKAIGTINRINFDESDGYNEATLFDVNGKVMEWTDLKKGDVLLASYIEDVRGKRIYTAKMVEKTVSGMVTSVVGPVGTFTRQVEVGGNTYPVCMSAEYNQPMHIGENVILYLDEYDRVIYSVADRKYLGNYGYVVDVDLPDDSELTSVYKLKLLTRDGELNTFDIADKIKYNQMIGVSFIKDENMTPTNSKELSESILTSLVDMVITYELNSSDEIFGIYTAQPMSAVIDLEEEFDFDDSFAGSLYNYDSDDMSFDRYTVSEDTIIIIRNPNVRADAEIVPVSALNDWDKIVNARLFDVDENDNIGCILAEGIVNHPEMEDEDEPVDDGITNAMFVLKISEKMDADLNIKFVVSGYENLQPVSYEIDYYPNNIIGSLAVPVRDENGKIVDFVTTGAVSPVGNKCISLISRLGKIDGNRLYVGSDTDYNGIVDDYECSLAARLKDTTNVYVFDMRKAATGRGHYQIDANGYLAWDEVDGIYCGTNVSERNLAVTAQIFYIDNNAVDVLYIIN